MDDIIATKGVDGMEQEILKILQNMQSDMQNMRSDMQNMQTNMDSMRQEFSQKFEQIDSRLDGMDSRLDKIDSRLDKVEQETRKTSLIIENELRPNIQLLCEGHTDIIKRLKKLSVVDELNDRVTVLESAFRYLSGELQKLQA